MLGRATTKVIDGKPYIFGKISLPHIYAFRDWIKEQIGDPFRRSNDLLEKAERQQDGPLKETLTKLFLEQFGTDKERAKQLEFFDPASPLFQQASKTIEGGAKWCQIMLASAHPDISEQEAFDVLTALGPAEIEEITQKGMGLDQLPKKNGAVNPGAGSRPGPNLKSPSA